ncbi:HAD-IA family hydrolase [Streptomyces sp. NBC_00102]|uniref:HAD-IA family hydrolase n=1 Tax=Streptomyces sp. NBC_00102 TaxID=2975652 RepID=UPI002259D7D1|nr:HAD-IA family hydrolase [Streptomyces sp. NBC_00102]MCX5399866.1 HAD-IA family hydrolase [Streptomyces sp. NBC_00102]
MNNRPLTDTPRHIVFDMDGVLVDSFPVMRKAFAVAYREAVGEGPAPFEEYTRHLGRYFPDIMRIMGLPTALQEPFVRESYRLEGEVPLFPGVRDLLRELNRRGVELAVATGKSGERARSLLRRLNALHHFAHVIGSDEVAHAKPAPDIVLRAMGLMGANPATTVMVGDAVTDLASARGAGIAGIAAVWAETDEAALLAMRPAAVLRSPGELLELIGQTAAR